MKLYICIIALITSYVHMQATQAKNSKSSHFNDIAKLLTIQQGEFEPTDIYLNRLNTFINQTYTFQLTSNLKDEGKIENLLKYDPDSNEFVLKLGNGTGAILYLINAKSSSTAEGRNAFGVSAKYQIKKRDVFKLIVANREFGHGSGIGSVEIGIPANPDQAKALSGILDIRIECRPFIQDNRARLGSPLCQKGPDYLNTPFVNYSNDKENATLSNPKEIFTKTISISIIIDKIIVTNSKTNEFIFGYDFKTHFSINSTQVPKPPVPRKEAQN